MSTGGALKIIEGYIEAPELKGSQKLSNKHLTGYEGVQINDFLFKENKDIEGFYVGDEMLEVPAGTTETTHCRKSNQGQTVDFWIADQAKPIGLVKLISKSDIKANQNYTISLFSLLKNVSPKINSHKAKPLDERGKSFITTPLK